LLINSTAISEVGSSIWGWIIIGMILLSLFLTWYATIVPLINSLLVKFGLAEPPIKKDTDKELTTKGLKNNDNNDDNEIKNSVTNPDNFTQNNATPPPDSLQKAPEEKKLNQKKLPEEIKIPEYIKKEVQQMNFDVLREKIIVKPTKYTPKKGKSTKFRMDYENV